MLINVPTSLEGVLPRSQQKKQETDATGAQPQQGAPSPPESAKGPLSKDEEAEAEQELETVYKPPKLMKQPTPTQAGVSKVATGAEVDATDAAKLKEMSSADRLKLLEDRAKAKTQKRPDVKDNLADAPPSKAGDPPKTPTAPSVSKEEQVDGSGAKILPSAFDFTTPRAGKALK